MTECLSNIVQSFGWGFTVVFKHLSEADPGLKVDRLTNNLHTGPGWSPGGGLGGEAPRSS